MTDNPKSKYNLESIDTIDDILPYTGLPHVTLRCIRGIQGGG